MRKRNNELFAIIKRDILNNIKAYIIVTVIFATGIFLGVMYINQTNSKKEIENYLNTYIDETKNIKEINYINELNKDIRNNVALVIALWFAGTTIIGIPFVFGIIIYRGFCLGTTISACVYVFGKFKGIAFIFINIFLHNLIFIPSLMVLGVSSIKLYKSIIKDRRKENIKISILRHTFISLLVFIALIIASIIKIEISYRILVNLIKYF